MKKGSFTAKPPAKKHVLGRESFAAISAVEGLVLSREGRRRIESGNSLEHRRTEILRAYTERKKSK